MNAPLHASKFTFAHPYFEPPFVYSAGSIWGSGDGGEKLLDLRGWGHLTGTGAHNLPGNQAAGIQDQLGEQIAQLLTLHWTTPAITEEEKCLLDALKAKCAISRYENAARAVIRSARHASNGQDLVLRDALLELARIVGEPLHTA